MSGGPIYRSLEKINARTQVPPVAAEDFDNVCEEIYGKSRSLLRKLNFFEPPNTFLKRGVRQIVSLCELQEYHSLTQSINARMMTKT